MCILETIHNHQDLVALNEEERKQLCQEIREFLIARISKTGGHVSSNLGVVELTVAIETVYDTAKDRLVFDVGHQSYIHKLLTGRQTDFDRFRQYGGLAGFPKPSESDTDAFVAGHASSSVSIALGMARARTLSQQDYDVVALIGDGAATGGMAFEGLNDAGVSAEPLVVILNDNELSIDRNVGGMARHLSRLRTTEKYLGMKKKYRNFMLKIPGGKVIYRITRGMKDRIRRMLLPTTIFENMGFTYIGPVDGHDTENLISLLRLAKEMDRPVLLHVLTQKGKGYWPAEEHPKLFHGIGKFDADSGVPLKKASKSFSDAFGEAMLEIAAEDPRLCAITAAMPGGTGLLDFKKQYPDRLFDVGIAEEHAVSMAGGLAKQGMIPVVALYSTFLQRTYDMILQDICILGLHVIFAVDRAGLVGEDGETHHGLFDIGLLRQAPGMTVLCPGSYKELRDMLRWAYYEQDGPVAIRYPRGGEWGYDNSAWNSIGFMQHKGALQVCHSGKDAVVVTYSKMSNNVLSAAEILAKKGIDITVLRLLSVEPIPAAQIAEHVSAHTNIFVVEETCTGSGIREALSWEMSQVLNHCNFHGIDLGHRYIPHGAVEELHCHCGTDAESIAGYIEEVLKVEK